MRRSTFVAAADSYPLTVVLAVSRGEIDDSTLDTGAGALYPGLDALPTAETILRRCTIRTSGNGIVNDDGFPSSVIIEDSALIGTYTAPYADYMPLILNTQAQLLRNHIFVPYQAYGARGSFQVFSILEGVALSSENVFSTDLVPTFGGSFATAYEPDPGDRADAAHVVDDHYVSVTAFQTLFAATFVPGHPYSQ